IHIGQHTPRERQKTFSLKTLPGKPISTATNMKTLSRKHNTGCMPGYTEKPATEPDTPDTKRLYSVLPRTGTGSLALSNGYSLFIPDPLFQGLLEFLVIPDIVLGIVVIRSQH